MGVQCVYIDVMEVGTNSGSVWVCYRACNIVKICVYVVQIVVCACAQRGTGYMFKQMCVLCVV